MTDHTQEMTFNRLVEDEFRVIELAMPTDPTPQLLGEARGWCLSQIERIEMLIQDGWPIEDLPETMRQARVRLQEIDAALSALGYVPDNCGWNRPPLH